MAELSAYAKLLRDPRWQRKKAIICERDDWKCRGCGETEKNLQVHHKSYIRGLKPWEYEDRFLVTLCEDCHQRATDLNTRANTLLGELNLYELPMAVRMLENFWSSQQKDPMQATIEQLESEKAAIIAAPFTPAASRELERLDDLTDSLWAHLQPRGAV